MGGGWDSTARLVGDALADTGLIEKPTYHNYKGAGGWRGFEKFISDPHLKNGIMVQSSPIIFRKLLGIYRKGYQDLVPIASLLGVYEAIVIKKNSSHQTLKSLINGIKSNPPAFPIVLGSSRGSVDHIAATIILSAAGMDDISKLRFYFRDGDARAIETLLQNKGKVMISGYGGDLIQKVKNKNLMVLAVSKSKNNEMPKVSSLYEHGIESEFINWRGFFARPDLNKDRAAIYETMLFKLSETKKWKKILKNNNWFPLVKTGSIFSKFLQTQEVEAKKAVSKLGEKSLLGYLP